MSTAATATIGEAVALLSVEVAPTAVSDGAALAARTRQAQGLPARITDTATLAKVAALLPSGRRRPVAAGDRP
jgi:hypothetical protein